MTTLCTVVPLLLINAGFDLLDGAPNP